MVRQAKCRCQTVINIPDDTPEGSYVRCPDCGELCEVPGPSSEPFSKDLKSSQEKIDDVAPSDHLADRDTHAKIFMIVGLAILLIVGVALLMMTLGRGGGLDAAGWDFVPENVMVIGMFDMDVAMQVPAIRDAAEALENNPDAQALRGMGISLPNLKKVYIAVPEAGLGDAQIDPMILFQTKTSMDTESIIETLQADEQLGEREDVAGLTAFHLARTELENPGMMLFAAEDIMAFGSPEMVRETGTLAAGETDRSVRRNSRMMELSGKTGGRDLLWFAALVPEGADDEYFGSPRTALILGNYVMETGLQLDATLNYADSESAGRVAEQLQPMMGMMALIYGIDQESMTLRSVGQNVEISAVVPPEILAALIGGGEL